MSPLCAHTGVAWGSGVNEAVCTYNPAHQPPVEYDELTYEACGCGFWAYWELTPHTLLRREQWPVAGIIEGTGRTLIGERGFRCQTAAIKALHFPVDLVQPVLRLARSHTVYRFYEPSWDVGGDVLRWPPEYSPGQVFNEPEIESLQDWALAWTSVVEDRLSQLHPEARIFSSVQAMLAAYPPGEGR